MIAWLSKHNVLARVLSVIIAIFVWFFVMAEINPDVKDRVRGIDVVITDVDQLAANGLAIVSGGNEKIDVQVSGKRDKIVLVGADKFNVTASAAQITVPGTYKLNCNTVVDVDGVSIISKNPSQITVVVDRVSSKTVPAEISFAGNMVNNYILESYTLSPDAIVVKGPQTQLQKIASAKIVYNVDYLTRSISTTLSYRLVDSKGEEVDMSELTLDTPAIVFSATVKHFKNVPLKVGFISNGLFNENVIKCEINPGEITLYGDYESVRIINQINLGNIDIEEFLLSGEEELSYDILLPNGVYSDDSAGKATVSITTPDYSFGSVSVSVDQIQPVDGYTFKADEVLSFDVFGQNDIVDNITSAYFAFYVEEIKEEKDGSYSATLDIVSTNPKVTAVGKYTVTAYKN